MATMPEDFRMSPRERAQAEYLVRAARQILAGMQPALGILDRQRDAMEAIRGSFEAALRVQPPPETRQALADLVHRLRGQSLTRASAQL